MNFTAEQAEEIRDQIRWFRSLRLWDQAQSLIVLLEKGGHTFKY